MIPKLIREKERTYKGRNNTRCYYIVKPKRGGEARVDVWAVKRSPDNQLVAKNVIKYYTDKDRYYVRDVLRNNSTNGLSINWAEQWWGRKHQAVWDVVDDSSWGYCDYKFNRDLSQVFINGEWLNDFTGTRYEKCGNFYASNLHFKQYIECWNISHSTEFLAKGGLQRFISPSFVKMLSTDKDFFTYFRSSIKQIVEGYYGKGDVIRSYRTKESLDVSSWYLKNMAYLIPYQKNIPKEIDRKELFRYFEKNGIDACQYAEYCRNIQFLGLSIKAHGLMFPLLRTIDRINDLAVVKMRRIRKENEKKRLKMIEDRIKMLHRIEKAISKMKGKIYTENMAIVFPKTNDEYINEGNAMDNCIGSIYTLDDMNNIICFIRKDDKPYVDVRISANDFKVMEARYKNNLNASNNKNIKMITKEIVNNLKKESKFKLAS